MSETFGLAPPGVAQMSKLQGKSGYVVSGVRPSAGAEMLENDATCEISETLERAEFAAAEDGQCH